MTTPSVVFSTGHDAELRACRRSTAANTSAMLATRHEHRERAERARAPPGGRRCPRARGRRRGSRSSSERVAEMISRNTGAMPVGRERARVLRAQRARRSALARRLVHRRCRSRASARPTCATSRARSFRRARIASSTRVDRARSALDLVVGTRPGRGSGRVRFGIAGHASQRAHRLEIRAPEYSTPPGAAQTTRRPRIRVNPSKSRRNISDAGRPQTGSSLILARRGLLATSRIQPPLGAAQVPHGSNVDKRAPASSSGVRDGRYLRPESRSGWPDPSGLAPPAWSSLATKLILFVFVSTFAHRDVVSWISIQSTYGSLREHDRAPLSALARRTRRSGSTRGCARSGPARVRRAPARLPAAGARRGAAIAGCSTASRSSTATARGAHAWGHAPRGGARRAARGRGRAAAIRLADRRDWALAVRARDAESGGAELVGRRARCARLVPLLEVRAARASDARARARRRRRPRARARGPAAAAARRSSTSTSSALHSRARAARDRVRPAQHVIGAPRSGSRCSTGSVADRSRRSRPPSRRSSRW